MRSLQKRSLKGVRCLHLQYTIQTNHWRYRFLPGGGRYPSQILAVSLAGRLCPSLQSLPAGLPFHLCIPLVADHHTASVSSPQTKSIFPGATRLWLSHSTSLLQVVSKCTLLSRNVNITLRIGSWALAEEAIHFLGIRSPAQTHSWIQPWDEHLKIKLLCFLSKL